jgi:undecaprenyl-diphosphatase
VRGDPRSAARRLDAALRRLNLSRRSAAGLAVALVVLAGALAYFGELIEDVTRHNDIVSTDGATLRWFVERRGGDAVDLSRALDTIATPLVLWAVAVLVAVALWRRGPRLFLVVAPAASLALAAIAGRLVKAVVDRTGPPTHAQLVSGEGASFPSVRVAALTALVLTCALIIAVFVLRGKLARTLIVGAALVAVAVVGWTRMLLGVQWLSDVVAGAVLGLVVALVVTIAAVLFDAMAPSDWPTRRRDRVWRLLNLRRRASASARTR